MEIKKLFQVVYRILELNDYSMPYIKVIKLAYLVDRAHIETTSTRMAYTRDRYVAMKFGPVMSGLFSLISEEKLVHDKKDDNIEQGFSKFFKITDSDISTKKEHDLARDIPEETKVLIDDISAYFEGKDAWETVDWTHENCNEWSDPEAINRAVDEITVFDIRDAIDNGNRLLPLYEKR